MGNGLKGLLFILIAALAPPPDAAAQMRIKDLVTVEGVRSNQLVGYGLVVGLPGSGDRLTNTPFTQRSLESMLERLGVSVREEDMRTRNVAAVMVTASLPPFARHGSRIDVQISALGDATSLLGGTLLVTPLMGANGEVYALAQGPVVVSGFEAQGDAGRVSKGVPTSARIPNGAVVEEEVGFDLDGMTELDIALRNPDFTTAIRIADTINDAFGARIADAADSGTVELAVPPAYRGEVARLIARVERLSVAPDQIARVVVDERSGTIVIGDRVRISRVAVTQGSITIQVTETPQVSQPQPFAQGGGTQTVPRTQLEVEEGTGQFAVIEAAPTLQELVDALNTLGVGPRDIIAILQAIKAAGALHAELVVE